MSDSGQPLTIDDNGLVTSIGPKPVSIEELAEEVEKLNDLLQNPHPDLITWVEFLSNQMNKVSEILVKLGYIKL